MITFGTLQADGNLTNITRMEKSVFANCPFTIFIPEHYETNGSCKCHDPIYRKTVMKAWGYKAKDFKKKGLV